MERRAILQCVLVGAAVPWRAIAQSADGLWPLLQAGGQVVLVRHALTEPGVGDPPGFRLGACGTQRNLSEQGRADARRLGAVLRERRVPVARVLSSPWCRCRETARLIFGREGEVEPSLGNLFGRRELEAQQVAELRKLVRRAEGGNLFMVTHGSTTHALTGVSPGTGEMVVLTPQAGGGFRVAGRLAPD
ncbi:MAG TPA: histidine phosphatase family protein [Ramlibacter sp.]